MDSCLGTDSQDSDDLVPPGLTPSEYDKSRISMSKKNLVSTPTASPGFNTKGIQNAKKKLRAFSIQKKKAITPVSVPKPVNTGSATVLIGKLSSVKTTPKPDKDVDAEKKPPKPPKPGAARRKLEASYSALQKRTLCEIEDMKRKMELVELGIPLGLICPSPSSDQAMPTKAMPPIKTFLDHSKVDELIREAKKAKAAGKEFKFDYQKLLPDYDNPFQRKKDDLNVHEKDKREEEYHRERKEELERAERRISGKWYDKHSDYDKHDKMEEKDKKREEKEKYKSKEREKQLKDEVNKTRKETDVNLSEYVVCDSWSLDNEDRSVPSPKVEKAIKLPEKEKPKEPMEILLENVKKKDKKSADSPPSKPKMERLKPVIDAFKFDIDPNEEDDALDAFDEDCQIDKFAKKQSKKDVVYDSPIDLKLFDYDQDMSKDIIDANDDNFLESVINEIKQENMSDDTSQDNINRTGLVEYDSPNDEEFKLDTSQGSVTPELDERMRDLQSSQQSHYSDGYRSTESYKSTESGYKSTESYKSDYKTKGSRHRADSRQSDDFRLSVEKEPDNALDQRMSRSTVDSLETWSFVLKICQPLLFRHDKNKCYKETLSPPKLWYTTNPKWCDCVKDRSVVYEELEMCKMMLVDRVYGCDQIPDGASYAEARAWYPRVGCVGEGAAPPLSTDWETDEPPRSTTPLHDGGLDREYQRFIESVWPDVAEPKSETTRSTTPDRSETGRRQESRKKKKAEDGDKATEDKKKAKKMKLSSEGWSQESDFEEEVEKTKKLKTEKEKTRKRKHSTSSSDSDSDKDSKKKNKNKKKDLKKTKGKKRRVSKKIKKKLKEKQKKKRKIKIEKISIDSDKEEKDKKKEKKLIKKTQIKAKKTPKKKKAKPVTSSSSSSSSYSSSDSEAEVHRKKIKKKELLSKKKKKDKKKKKRRDSSDSTHSDDLFDVNILKNIKTERLSDDENSQQMNDFSPRRQKYTTKEREIINVKELQNDFVGNNIHIKQEKEDVVKISAEKFTPEMRSEQRTGDVPEPVETKPKVFDYKEKSPSLEPLSPEIPFIEKFEIPLPDETKIRPNNTLQYLTIASPEKQEQTTIHLTAESNIPLPAEMKTQNIPEPPPQIIEKVPKTIEKVPQIVEKVPQVIEKVPQVIEKVPQVIERVPQVIERVPQVIERVPQVIERVPQAIEKVPQAIEKVPQVIEKVPQVIEKVSQEIEKCIEPQILSYGYTDVSASQNDIYNKGIDDSDDKSIDYDQENYEMYEQMAMAYQSDVANQKPNTVLFRITAQEEIIMLKLQIVLVLRLYEKLTVHRSLKVLTIDQSGQARPIETVVRCRRRGEIKCDWRAADNPAPAPAPGPAPASASATVSATRPSRWGLKPSEVNIVLTGGPSSEHTTPAPEQYPIRSVCEPVYKIQSLANRHDTSNSSIDYDEAYQVTYGASDRLQYGDCFGEASPVPAPGDSVGDHRGTKLALSVSTLDERINRVLQQTALGEAAKDTEDLEGDKDAPEKGILVTKPVDPRLGKRVSFADGYKPGQDSDTEEPPIKRQKKKPRRYGCAWPCPATHPDHVPLWDALPPPPPPPRSPPPPPAAPPPPIHLLRAPTLHMLQRATKTDPTMSLPPFMPPEPPPGIISFK